MKTLYTLFVLTFCLFLNVQGQVSGDFRFKTGGTANWNDFNAWETYNGASRVAAVSDQLPAVKGTTEIQAPHTMTVNTLLATPWTSGNLNVNGSTTCLLEVPAINNGGVVGENLLFNAGLRLETYISTQIFKHIHLNFCLQIIKQISIRSI
jgi:hypothetical protein